MKVYRPEIDGLRAVAVIPVVLYHAGISQISGGFTGVDIFFVISGYLITSIIIDDIQNNKFSFISFYERRARRILPALVVVILSTLLAMSFVSLPSDLILTAKSSIFALIGLSNFFFWGESGYFSPSTDFMPLLHTWSLGVEEQFYLFMPAILIIFVRLVD